MIRAGIWLARSRQSCKPAPEWNSYCIRSLSTTKDSIGKANKPVASSAKTTSPPSASNLESPLAKAKSPSALGLLGSLRVASNPAIKDIPSEKFAAPGKKNVEARTPKPEINVSGPKISVPKPSKPSGPTEGTFKKSMMPRQPIVFNGAASPSKAENIVDEREKGFGKKPSTHQSTIAFPSQNQKSQFSPHALKPPAISGPGLSVRDAFIKVAEQRAMGIRPEVPARSAGIPPQSAAPTRAAGAKILESLSSTLPKPAAMGEGFGVQQNAAQTGGMGIPAGIGAIDNAGLTEGELRVLRHEENMRRKRQKMEEDQWSGATWRQQREGKQQQDRNELEAKRREDVVKRAASTRGQDTTFGENANAEHVETPAEMKKRILAELVRKSGYAKSGSVTAAGQTESGTSINKPKPNATVVKTITMPAKGMTIRELASALSLRLIDIHEKLNGEDGSDRIAAKSTGKKSTGKVRTEEEAADAAENDRLLDADTAELIALEAGVDVKREKAEISDKFRERVDSGAVQTVPRDPIVCVMGHVDHGKTTLLDTLRKASVAAGEAGGITQKISAFRVHNLAGAADRQVVFLDTPGHAAFSTMRSHGVSATDLVILVVAIDDGVKMQTKEALRTAKEAGCTIIVALNKCDKIPDSNSRKEARARVLAQLVAEGLVAEDYGGDTMVVETSAQTGLGLSALVESIGLQADMMGLLAANEGQCEAVVLDAAMEKGKGVVADILVKWGRLSVGDNIVVDTMYGKVKAMQDDAGNPLETAGPSTPVRILGLRTVPTAGQEMLSVESESRARNISERRQRVHDMRAIRRREAAAGEASTGARGGVDGVPTIDLILKADAVGTLEALDQVVRSIGQRTREVHINVVHQSVGDINKRDVETASTSNAVVLGFNVNVADGPTRSLAKELDVPIGSDNIIYRLEEKLIEEMQNLLPKEKKEIVEGEAHVTTVFSLNDKKNTKVAGMVVNSGIIRTSGTGSQTTLCFTVTRASAAKEHADIVRRIARDPALADPQVPDAPYVGYDVSPNSDLSKGIIFRETRVNPDTVVLKRFKDVVNIVENGMECGFVLTKFNKWQEGDVVHSYKVQMAPKDLVLDPISS